MITEKNTILKLVALRPEEGLSATVESNEKVVSLKWNIEDANGKILANGEESSASVTAIFDAAPWSVESPTLYTFTAEVKFANGEVETISDRFGFRYFSADNKNIYLNGFPLFVRAYIRGCAAHEHQNNCNLSEYEFYKKNITQAKSYGFNTVRFHSVIPPEECFRAADELGILIHIEMRRESIDYDNLSEMLYGKNDFVSNEELTNIINSLYNHPSFMVYCVGNEIRQPGKKPRIREIRDFIKERDPNRLFIDTCAHGEYDRDYVDFDVQHMGYYFPYGKNADMFENTDNLLCFGTVNDRDMVVNEENSKIRRAIAFSRPLLAHEVCHYTSWRDFYALKEKFEKYGRPAPWWVDEEIKMIEAKGYKENFHDYLQITKDYQYRCWKQALEGIRSSKLLSGFHMLQFADTDKYENSNGVVDCFDDRQGISSDDFRAFNADTVLLARLPKQIYASNETVKIPVLLSQYMINPPKSATFTYNVSDIDGKTYFSGTLTDVDTFESGLYSICSLELTMPECAENKKLILTCKLDFVDGSTCENFWELWVFPEVKKLSLNAKADMNESYLNNTCIFNDNANVTITDKLDDATLEKIANGQDTILIYRTDWTRHLLHKDMAAPQYSFRAVWERYKGVIWDRGTINGGFDKKDILNRHGFVTDGQINFQYYPVIEDCDKINLDDFPIEVDSLVSGLDKSSRDRFDPGKFNLPELMYDRTMRHFSYAFSFKLGKGKLLVTGFNFTGVDKLDPAACAMLKTLISYCNSADFAPKNEISLADFKAYLKGIAESGPQKERMMTQYWQLDNEPVESMEYWTESERYLREDM